MSERSDKALSALVDLLCKHVDSYEARIEILQAANEVRDAAVKDAIALTVEALNEARK